METPVGHGDAVPEPLSPPSPIAPSPSPPDRVTGAVSAPPAATGPGLGEIYDAHAATVYAYLRRRVDAAEAEDLTAEVFHAAARAFEDGRGHRVTVAWLMVTARNLVIDRWRRAERHRRRLPLLVPTPPADEATSDRVLDALDRLLPRQRASLVLRYLEDRPVAEVAMLLGVGVAAAESLLARARREFRRRLDEVLAEH